MRDFLSGQSAASPGWDSWRSRVTRTTYRRVQRWSFLCGCRRVCTRRRGGCCPWSCPRCTERAGGPCSTLTPTWWICTRWGPTTTAWAPRCCTLTAQRILRSHRRCCRRSSGASGGTWTRLRTRTTRTRRRWWSVWTAWRRLCSRRGRVASTASRAGRRAGPRSSPPPAWCSTTARGRSTTCSPDPFQSSLAAPVISSPTDNPPPPSDPCSPGCDAPPCVEYTFYLFCHIVHIILTMAAPLGKTAIMTHRKS